MDIEAEDIRKVYLLFGHKVAKNTVYQLIGKFFTAVSTLLVLRVLTSHYGSGGVAEFTLVLNFINIFYLIADFGINATIVKRMVEQPDQELWLFKNLFGLRLITGCILIVIAVLIAQFVPFKDASDFSDEFKVAVAVLSLSIISQSIYLSTAAVFQKYLMYGRSIFALSAGALISLATFYWLAQQPDTPLPIPLCGYLFGNVAAAAIALLLLPFPVRHSLVPRFSFRLSKSLVLASLPIAATLVLNVIYFKSDSFILAAKISKEGVGIYGLAYKVFDQAIVIPVFFVNALYPILVNQFTYYKEKLQHTLLLSSVLLGLTGTALGLGIIIFAPLIMKIVAGSNDFAASILPLRILAAGLPLFFLSNLYLWLLVTLGKQRYLILIYGASMIFNIAFNIMLIPHYSYIASAWLTTISEGLVLIMTMALGLSFFQKLNRKGTL